MRNVFLLLLIAIIFLSTTVETFAQAMEDEDHLLWLDPVEDQTLPITKKPSNLSLTPTSLPAKKTPSFTVPFEKPTEKTISLSLTPTLIDFGIISPTFPTVRRITVSLNGTSEQMILYIRENHPLQADTLSIPQTSCDQGGCSSIVASLWESTLSFGLGYSCLHKDCDQDFADGWYRPFTQNLTPIFETSTIKKDHEVLTIPVKVNVSGTQENASYANKITILAIPSL